MSKFSLPPDDLPPREVTGWDGVMRRQLEDAASSFFYAACDRPTQELLSSCEWYITTNANALTLAIACPDMATNWRVLNSVVALGSSLEQLSSRAKIRVCPPIGWGTPFEIRVDEISVYRDSL